jgi:hypothetical protein
MVEACLHPPNEGTEFVPDPYLRAERPPQEDLPGPKEGHKLLNLHYHQGGEPDRASFLDYKQLSEHSHVVFPGPATNALDLEAP